MVDEARRGTTPFSTRVMNLAHFLTQTTRRNPARVGLVWGERHWTWAELEARVSAMARALVAEFGIRKGDRILVQSTNCNQMFESMFACFRAGAVWVPTNYRQSAGEVADLARTSGARGMICGSQFPDHVRQSLDVSPNLRFAISIGEAPFGESYERIVERNLGIPFASVEVDRDDPCWFFFTSGTTGRPKAAILTHGQMAFVVTNHLCDLMPGTMSEDASLVVAPLSHGAGIHQLAQVAHGAMTILLPTERLDVPTAWALVEKWRVSNMFTVPTILKLLVEDPSVDRFDHSSLRYVVYAGAPIYRSDQKNASRRLGRVLVQYFGLGEVTGAITVLPPGHHDAEDSPGARIGTCGFERTGMQVQVQDEEGDEAPAGSTGEICVIGPAVFAGYHDNPEANRNAFRNGWFRTGDLGHLDADGYVYLTGRASDMFISGGSNIHPREIEDKILLHPDVSEAVVLGMPDPLWGEIGVAVCVTRPGANPVDLPNWLDGRLARYKIPKRFFFWDDLPKSAYGKISRKIIREQLQRSGTVGLLD